MQLFESIGSFCLRDPLYAYAIVATINVFVWCMVFFKLRSIIHKIVAALNITLVVHALILIKITDVPWADGSDVSALVWHYVLLFVVTMGFLAYAPRMFIALVEYVLVAVCIRSFVSTQTIISWLPSTKALSPMLIVIVTTSVIVWILLAVFWKYQRLIESLITSVLFVASIRLLLQQHYWNSLSICCTADCCDWSCPIDFSISVFIACGVATVVREIAIAIFAYRQQKKLAVLDGPRSAFAIVQSRDKQLNTRRLSMVTEEEQTTLLDKSEKGHAE